MSEQRLEEVVAELAGLAQRVQALEQRTGGSPALSGRPVPDQELVPVPADPAGGQSEDPLWALHALQERLPHGVGAVVVAGSVPLATGGVALWQVGHPSEALLDADLEAVAARLAALASPVRLRLLREVLSGRTSSGELAADPQFGTTGQVQHHLRQLVAAGWLRSTARGRYAVPVDRVVPLLAAWAAAHP